MLTTRGQLARIRHFSGQLSSESCNALQRLHAGDLFFSYFVGFVEGDGSFSVTKNGKYVKWEFTIELSSRDAELIYKFKSFLGTGVISSRTREGRGFICLRIRDKYTLIHLVFPIFDKYPMLTNKTYDYLRFKSLLLSEVVLFEDLLPYERPELSLNNVNFLRNVPYFASWLVGFIEAEGCFSVFKPLKETSFISSFSISQTNEQNIIVAIQFFLNVRGSIFCDETKNYKLKIQSIQDVEKIILFMQNAPVRLLGCKRLQYLVWLEKLRKIPRYSSKFNIPMDY